MKKQELSEIDQIKNLVYCIGRLGMDCPLTLEAFKTDDKETIIEAFKTDCRIIKGQINDIELLLIY